MTLEMPFVRFAVRTVHIREVGGASPSAPIFETLVQCHGFLVQYMSWSRKVNRAIDLIWRNISLFWNRLDF